VADRNRLRVGKSRLLVVRRSEDSNRIARRCAEPGWRAAVLDEGASRHAFGLRATEEGSGSRAPASASGASNAIRNEPTRLSSGSDDEVGDFAARSAASGASHRTEREQRTQKNERGPLQV
jgi:hypothetical protein